MAPISFLAAGSRGGEVLAGRRSVSVTPGSWLGRSGPDQPPPLCRLHLQYGSKVQYTLNLMNQALIERFVEELGMQLELDAGAPRMVGRALGWLLVCDPPEQSAADLAESLQASKGSISAATRVLLRMGLIERVRVRGERFDRFIARPEAWDEFLWRDEQFSAPRRVLRLGLDALAGEPPGRRARLEEMDALYAWWETRLPKLREEYLQERRRGRGRDTKRGGR